MTSTTREPDQPKRKRGKLYRTWQGFWLLFLVVSLAYAWYCFYVPSNSIVWADNFASAQQQAAKSDKPMILFFSGAWCVPCRIMKRTVWADEQVAAKVNESLVPLILDVDDPNAADLISRYGVRATPVTIITDPQGNPLESRVGGMSKPEFLEMLEAVK